MRLADFIVANVEPILVEWEAFARGIAPGAKMDGMALRDHAEEILLATARDASDTRRVDQSRDLFLAILRHDLRNPLNSIAMSAALLRRSARATPRRSGMPRRSGPTPRSWPG